MQQRKWHILQIIIIVILAIQLISTGGIIAYLYLTDDAGGDKEASENKENSTLAFKESDIGKYVLYIGMNDKETYTQLIPTDEAKEKVNEICSRYVDGYTVQTAEGGWVDETGTLTEETTLIYSFDDTSESDIISIMDEVLEELNQNSILVEKEDLAYCYYDGMEE